MTTAAGIIAEDATSAPILGGAEQRLAGIYAQAFLDASAHKNEVDEILGELKLLVSLRPGNANPFSELIDSPNANREVRTGVIDRVFQNRVSESVLNFLHVLNDHDRLMLLIPIIQAFGQLVDRRSGRVAVHVRTATTLDSGAREALEQQLRETLGKEPVLHCTVEPDLLGGMIVRVGDRVWDGSLSWQIHCLQDQLMERGNYAIQSGRDRFRSDR